MTTIRKRILTILLIVFAVLFFIINIIWFDFSIKAKKMLSETKYEMTLDSESSNFFNRYYSYYDKTNKIGYNISIPGYMNFTCKINIAGTLDKIENEDGSFSYAEDYHVLNILLLHPFKKYKYQYMIGKTNDETGHISNIVLNNVYVNKNLDIIDNFHATANLDDINALFNDSYETVYCIHNTMLEFFGTSINSMW